MGGVLEVGYDCKRVLTFCDSIQKGKLGELLRAAPVVTILGVKKKRKRLTNWVGYLVENRF